MNEKSATPAAKLIASYKLPPDALNGPKFAFVTKNQPRVPTNSNGANLRTVVTVWTIAICRTPARLIAAGIQSPHMAIPKLVHADGLLIPKRSSTYSTHDETIAAFPAQHVIQ